jgi:hypothetical protein
MEVLPRIDDWTPRSFPEGPLLRASAKLTPEALAVLLEVADHAAHAAARRTIMATTGANRLLVRNGRLAVRLRRCILNNLCQSGSDL